MILSSLRKTKPIQSVSDNRKSIVSVRSLCRDFSRPNGSVVTVLEGINLGVFSHSWDIRVWKINFIEMYGRTDETHAGLSDVCSAR
jgi:hypothetical protein